jgi:hypothetical protein
MQAAYSDERPNLAEDMTKKAIGNNSVVSGDSMQRNSYDILQDGGKGFAIQDIITYFTKIDFVVEAMTFGSGLLHINTMADNELPFIAGATAG